MTTLLYRSRAVLLSPCRVKVRWSHHKAPTAGGAPTVQLASTVYPGARPALTSTHPPIVILHGLFGSKQNWRSLAKALAGRTFVDVHALDLRNHGESPHAEAMDYEVMSRDVERYIQEQGLGQAFVIGHSMGAKVAMTLALQVDPNVARRVASLVVVDMAPRRAALSLDFQHYLRAMMRANDARAMKSSLIDDILRPDIPDKGVRQFLMTNCKRATPTEPYSFRLPLQTIERALPNISDFPPAHQPHGVYHDPALFIMGKRSSYVGDEDAQLIQTLFPRAELITLDAGHWVHAEQPGQFLDEVVEFYSGSLAPVSKAK